MKKIICFAIALMLCVTAVFPAFAADEFTPSVSYKGSPEIVPVKDENGNTKLGAVRDASGSIIGYLDEDCLVITPVSKASTSTEIPDEAEKQLLMVYNALTDGSMELPYDKVDANIDPDKMVIRDLFDATWLCGDHPEIIAPEGVVLELTFDLGVAANTDVVVMTYKNDEWNPIAKVVNNGDGTVTCTFEHLCPIAFAVPTSEYRDDVQTGDTSSMMVWVALLAVSAVAVVVLVAFRRKKVR